MAKGRGGRPRSEKAQEAILDAVRDLLRETGGGGLTIEAIARRAGVGRPTIYRRWATVADIVLDVLLRQAGAELPIPECGTFRETLNQFLRRLMQSIRQGAGDPLRFLMAQAQQDAEFHDRFRDNFVAARRTVLDAIIRNGMKSGEIDPGQGPDLLVDMIFGAMWYRLLTGHAPLDADFADALTNAAIALGSNQ